MSVLGKGWFVLVLAGAGAAAAQDRPDESAMFGAPAAEGDAGIAPVAIADAGTEVPSAAPAPSTVPTPVNRDAQELGATTSSRDAFASGESVENPLQIGGLFYQRAFVSGQDGTHFNNTPYSLPLQINAFMDARPNDRIRGYVLARLQYDPTLDGCSASTTSPIVNAGAPCPRSTGSATGGGNSQTASTSSAPTSFGTGSVLPNNPAVLLDQAWLKFDIARVVFVTVGKQHVKWGASHFWNPTDFLHTQKRDPLLPYDLRLGNTMAKFEVPFEAQQANFYAVALFDNPQPASSLGQLGGALRAEKVFGTTEVGAEAVFRNGLHPVIGADASAPVGPVDAYVEAAYRGHADAPIYALNLPPGVDFSGLLQGGTIPPGVPPNIDIAGLFTSSTPAGQFLQISGGFTYSFGYMDNRLATVGAEYFYNSLGYDSSFFYPALIFNGQFQPFYTGKHYAAIYASAEGPDEFKHTTFTLSNLGNISDKSFISRLDFSWRVLTYLTFEAYGDVHYGNKGGEFRFSLNTPPLRYAGAQVPALFVPAPTFDLGIGLRVSI